MYGRKLLENSDGHQWRISSKKFTTGTRHFETIGHCNGGGLEPFYQRRSDWKLRYASVFQLGSGSAGGDLCVKPEEMFVHGNR